MRTYITIGGIIILIMLLCCTFLLGTQLKRYREHYEIEKTNRKAIESEVDSLHTTTELLRYSIKDIKASNDSLTEMLYAANKKLKLKDKSLRQMQYLLSTATKADSVVLRDTLFTVRDIAIDTVVGDSWIKTRLQLKYPSTIKTTHQVKSEKMIFLNEVKKIDGKPSKLFFIRWFQKKYTTVEIDIIENNPYIVNDRNKFIEIIK